MARIEWAGSPKPPASPPQPALRARAGWYARVLAGLPFATVRGAGRTWGFEPSGTFPFTTLTAGAGWAVGDHLTVGGEWSVGYTVHVVDSASGAYDRDLVLQHLGAVATFFPLKQRYAELPNVALAPHGPFLRAGVAAAFLGSTPHEFDAPPGSTAWRENGFGVTAGVGWALLAKGGWTLDAELDLAWDRFSSSDPTAPDAVSGYLVNVGVTFF